MRTNIITAAFNTNNYVRTNPAYLYDHGMVLRITGVTLPSVYEVQFSNSKGSVSRTTLGGPNGVVIPDEYFRDGQQIYAWIYLHEGEGNGFTALEIEIPLAERPEDYEEIPSEAQASAIEQAITALNAAVTQTAADVASTHADVTQADASAAAALESEENALASANAAASSATSASGAATNAANSATAAANSATAAARSASDAQSYISDAADEADRAEQAANDASGYATNAAASATSAASSAGTATTKAGEAVQSANAASGSASAAAQSASSASSSATAASGSASAAAGSATNASNSATSAATSATAANTAKTAAETAQGKAESAKTAAETAQASVTAAANTFTNTTVPAATQAINDEGARVLATIPEDYTEMTEDVADLKSALGVMVSKNKIDMATITKNAAINNTSTSPNYGKLYTENGYNTTDFIPVSKGDFIRMYRNASANPVEGSTLFGNDGNAFRIAEYNSAREIIYCSANWVSLPYTVRTDGAAFIRITTSNANSYMLFVNEKSAAQPYYTAFKPEWAAITDLEKVFNPAEVITPSALYGVTGQQINIYKANLVAGNRLKSLAYIHTLMPDNAIQSDERTIWNPAGTALAESTKNWEVFKYGLENQPEIKPIKVCNVPKATGSGSIKVLVIGDSKVAGGSVTYHFLHSFDDDDMSCTLLGTQYSWTPDNRHEGYGSRTAQWMCTNAASPFCNNGAFDFANYLSANSIDTPDYVFINLGTNDAAQLSSGYAENFVTYITQMVDGIHSVSSAIKVIVGLCEGVCTTQDTNNAGFLNWDLNRKISILHKAAIVAFDNRASENIYVCPMYMGMDLTQDYRMNEVPLSQRDADVNNGEGDGKTRMQVIDTVHQSEVGYWKNADYMYALVKYITAKALA